LLVPVPARRCGRIVPKYRLSEEDWWSRDKTCDSPVNNAQRSYWCFCRLSVTVEI